NTNIGYGSVSFANLSGVAGTGSLAGAIGSSDLSVTANSGTIILAAGGGFDVTFTATPSAIGTYANPRSGGSATVDPNGNVTESNEANNSFSDSVTVTAPDLTATKTNNVSGATTLGNSWTWTVVVSNGGNAATTFATGQAL